MDSGEYKIEGLKEFMDAIVDLPMHLQKKVLKSFLSKAGRKFVVKELKASLPYSTKSKKGINVVADRREVAVYAGVTGKSFWLNWADRGTTVRKTKSGANRGFILAKNQVSRKVDEEIEPIIKYSNEEIGNETSKFFDRKLKKIRKIG